MTNTTAVPVRPRMSSPVPRWAKRVAHLIPLCVLPSGLWRIALVVGLAGYPGRLRTWERPYILSLTVASEAVALLAFGLVRPWGEVVPGWIPFAGGRRIPAPAVVFTAGLGALAVTALWTFAAVNSPRLADGTAGLHGPALWVVYVCYAPLLTWGPLLAALVVAYHRRHRSCPVPCPPPDRGA